MIARKIGLAGAAVVAGALVAGGGWTGWQHLASAAPNAPQPATQLQGPYAVTAVVDGDTIRINRDGRDETVRLLGIDTPETKDKRKTVECFGREASAQTTRLLSGSRVSIEPGPEARDKYGRTLGYVWTEDHRLINLELVRDGYAREYTYDRSLPGAHVDALRTAERDARSAGRGLWSPTSCGGGR